MGLNYIYIERVWYSTLTALYVGMTCDTKWLPIHFNYKWCVKRIVKNHLYGFIPDGVMFPVDSQQGSDSTYIVAAWYTTEECESADSCLIDGSVVRALVADISGPGFYSQWLPSFFTFLFQPY